MNNTIDLEDAIYLAWKTSDDLELFFKHHGDHPKPMTEDEVSNMIYGIFQLHEMRMEKLYDTYCRKFELNQYCVNPEVLEARKRLMGIIDEEVKPKKKGKKK